MSADKLWSIGIIDEGPPVPGIDHRKYNLMPTRNAFLERVVTGKIAPDQLTATKLERLMDRYAGKEWLPSRLKHLDFPERERADVLRGLRTYALASPANARRFADLYASLPVGRQRARTRHRQRAAGARWFTVTTVSACRRSSREPTQGDFRLNALRISGLVFLA